MSEVLRALLTDRSVSRKPAFYSCAVTTVSTVTGAKTFGRRQGFIPCKADCWFLAMGATQAACFTGAIIGWGDQGEPSTFQIQRASNYQVFSSFPTVKVNQNFNFNNFAAWNEYMLFKPSEQINIIEDVQVTDSTFSLTHTTFVTLAGMEYRFAGDSP